MMALVVNSAAVPGGLLQLLLHGRAVSAVLGKASKLRGKDKG